MAKKDILTDEKKISARKKAKQKKLRETILIIVIVTILVLIDAALVVAVLKYNEEHDHDHEEQATEFEYPEYSEDDKLATEGIYYDITKTGIGLDVDMDKVAKEIDAYDYDDFVATNRESDFVTIRIEDYGDIIVALRSDIAPKTVANFKKLVASDFYKDTVFHRVRKDFMIQGGGVTKSGSDKKTDAIYGEFTENGHVNNLLHERGIISMARTTDRDSATSQFFIMHADTADLNKLYASFGYVLAGMDVVDAIAKVEVTKNATTGEQSSPKTQIVIKDVFFVEPKKDTGIGVAEQPTTKAENYKIKVVDTDGKAVAGVTFKMTDEKTGKCPVYSLTNAQGEAGFAIEPSDYLLQIVQATGYKFDAKGYKLPEGTTELTITVEKLPETEE